MTKFILAALVAGISLSAQAYTCEWESCSTTITADSGHTGYKCEDDSNMYSCALGGPLGGGCRSRFPATAHGVCPTNYDFVDWSLSGYNWCVNFNTCFPQSNGLAQKERVEAFYAAKAQAAEDGLEDTFTVSAPGMTDTYFGWIDTAIRSPNNGRANSIHARLDACLNYTDVDTVTATGWNLVGEQNCETQCGAGHLNDYCLANSGTVCKDRCACLYQVNGVSGLTCNNY
jgi:hypothetical protein